MAQITVYYLTGTPRAVAAPARPGAPIDPMVARGARVDLGKFFSQAAAAAKAGDYYGFTDMRVEPRAEQDTAQHPAHQADPTAKPPRKAAWA